MVWAGASRVRRLPAPAVLVPLFLAALGVGCQTAGPARTAAGPPAQPSPRVVLLSLDGGSWQELERYVADGAFGSDGFARFFAEGQVADGLQPVEPSLTAPSHISLATGRSPGETGIVSNDMRLTGRPLLERTSGFAAPIAAETLWEACRRQGRAVGVVTWPGADNTDLRRRADWGMVYVNEPLVPARLIELDSAEWTPLPTALPGVTSFSPLLHAGLTLESRRRGNGADRLDLVAVDGRDDGVAAYDRLVVRRLLEGGVEGREDAVTAATAPLAIGDWGELRGSAAAAVATTSWLTVEQLAPDLAHTAIYFAGRWETLAYPEGGAYASALRARGVLWPGPPDDHAIAHRTAPTADRLPTWLAQSGRFADFFADALLVGLATQPADLVMAYFPVIDEAGHSLSLVDPRQSGYTPELAAAFAAGRLRVWQNIDRELARLLAAIDLGRTAVVVVADHGMAPIWGTLMPNVVLRQAGLLTLGADGRVDRRGLRAYASTAGAVAHIYLNLVGREPEGTVDPGQAGALLADIRERLLALRDQAGSPVVQRLLTREEAAAIGMGHANAGDLIAWGAPGWAMSWEPTAETPMAPARYYGQHGFPATGEAMQASYLAIGKGVAPGRIPRLRGLDVAGRVAALLGIEPPLAQPSAAPAAGAR